MKIVTPFLKSVVYPSLAKSGYLRRHASELPTVLTYHGILPEGYEVIDPALDGSMVCAAAFRRQLQLLKREYNVISPERFLGWCKNEEALPARSILLTCDDGLQNTLTDMLPILKEYELSCLFFVTGASLKEQASILWYEELYLMFLNVLPPFSVDLREWGADVVVVNAKERRAQWWGLVKELSRFDEKKRASILERIRIEFGLAANWIAKYLDGPAIRRRFSMLNMDELRQLSESGMSIGAHTQSHPMLSRMVEELAWREIFSNKKDLERFLGKPVWAMAYPFGDADSAASREQEMAERAGFECAFLNFGGQVEERNGGLFSLPRVHVTGDMELPEFEAHVSGLYQLLRSRFFGEPTEVGRAVKAEAGMNVRRA